MDDPRQHFGTRLRNLRTETGWSQEKLALECGLDRTYIGSVERGERNIALLNICKLARALNAEPSELMKFEPPKEHRSR